MVPQGPENSEGHLCVIGLARLATASGKVTQGGGAATYLGRQAVADRIHVVGGRRRVHEAVGVTGEAVAGSVG